VLEHRIMKAYVRPGGEALYVLDLGVRRMWVVLFTILPLYPWGRKVAPVPPGWENEWMGVGVITDAMAGETTFPSAAEAAVSVDVTWSLFICTMFSLQCSIVISFIDTVFQDRRISVPNTFSWLTSQTPGLTNENSSFYPESVLLCLVWFSQ
jgi:hypothetical protein